MLSRIAVPVLLLFAIIFALQIAADAAERSDAKQAACTDTTDC